MKVDRILIDIFDWVRRLVFSRTEKTIAKPYQRLESWRGNLGVLHRVDRDTPRAVVTYVFCPFRCNGFRIPNPVDLHVCLDHLSLLPGHKTSRVIPFSHRVTVLAASHWPQLDGTYESSILYIADWDFQGSSKYRDRMAIAITHDVARLLKDRPWETIDWAFEFESASKIMLGADYQANKKPTA